MATWISITLVAWVALSVVVSMVIGGIIRVADARRGGEAQTAPDVRTIRRPSPQPAELGRVS